MKKHVILAVAMAAALAGCSSVPLDNVPVESRTGTSTATPPPTTQSQVTPVTSGTAGATDPGPANVARIVYFDYDSNAVKAEYQSMLSQNAQYLRAAPGRHIVIEGHTDERGGREYNLALGQRRSEAVRRSLGLLGVQDSQMEAVSFGKEKPADPGSNEAAWAKNRRAEITYR